mmetsp:Transcript_39530/g.95409  ORF Transcript_39530/g.95409 Transcript_39530/m.95409 type:complete len:1607 (-) Transcript_39530:300-5120(-)
MYPGGKAVTVDCTFSPLTILNEEGEKEHVAIVSARPIEDMDAGKIEANRAVEMLRHTPVQTALYAATGEHIQSNVTARNYYAAAHEKMSLEKVIESCEWKDEAEGKMLLERIKKLRLGDEAVKVETKKVPLWKLKNAQDEALETEGSQSCDQKDEVRVHDMSFIPTVDPGTGAPAIMVIENNITELEKMKLAEAQLLAAARQQEQFIAAVSHELRTPLNGIIGLSEYLIEDCAEDMDLDSKETLQTILQSAQRLNLLINDILDSAALKEGTMQIRQGEVDVDKAISQVCRQLSVLSNSGVVLLHHENPELPSVRGDDQRVCQILTNLIGNSLKFTHNGKVEVFAAVEEGGRMIKVTVKDTGIGIAPKDIDRMFLAFEQADMSAQRTYEGTGLGLSLVRQLVDGHGGSIWAESELGRGTSMTFTLCVFADGQEGASLSGKEPRRSRSPRLQSSMPLKRQPSRSLISFKGDKQGSPQQPFPEAQALQATIRKLEADLSSLSVENHKCREMLLKFGHDPPKPDGVSVTDSTNIVEHPVAPAEDGQLDHLQLLLKQSVSEKKEALLELEDTCTVLEEKIATVNQLEKEKSLLASSLSQHKSKVQQLEETNRKLHDDLNTAINAKPEHAVASEPLVLTKQNVKGIVASDSEGSPTQHSDNSDSEGRTKSGGKAPVQTSPLRPLIDGEDDQQPHVLSHRQLYGQTEILSVDDTPLNHLVIERILKRTNYKMSSCLNGMSALQLLEDRGYLPDMILLDVMMPGMSGHEVCHQLRQKYPTATVPIIMISAKSNPENILQGFSSGCIDYVCKPFSRHELLARINAQLRQVEMVANVTHLKGNAIQNSDTDRATDASGIPHTGAAGPTAATRSKPTASSPLLPEFLRNSATTPAPIVDTVASATVIVADIVNYELISSVMAADQLYETLQELFLQVDSIAEKRCLTRVEHDGDYIMLVGSGDGHADNCLQAGLDMLAAVRVIRSSSSAARRLGLAVGLQSGPVYMHSDKTVQKNGMHSTQGTVVYFGSTVSEARELEARGCSMTVSIGQAAVQALTPDKYRLEVWKWQHPWQRYLLVHDDCDWEGALQTAGKQAPQPIDQDLQATCQDEDGSQDVKLQASTKPALEGGPARKGSGMQRSRNILLQLQYDTEKQKVASLNSEIVLLRSQLQELSVVCGTAKPEIPKVWKAQACQTSSDPMEPPAPRADGSVLPSAPLSMHNISGEDYKADLARSARLAADYRHEMDQKMQAAMIQISALEARLRASERRGTVEGSPANSGLIVQEKQFEAVAALLERQIEEVRKDRGVVGAELVAIQKENDSLRQERSALLQRTKELEVEHQSSQREKSLIMQEKDQLLQERSDMRSRVRELERENSFALTTILNSSAVGTANKSTASSRGFSVSPTKSPSAPGTSLGAQGTTPQPVRPGTWMQATTEEGASLAEELKQLRRGMMHLMSVQQQPHPTSPFGAGAPVHRMWTRDEEDGGRGKDGIRATETWLNGDDRRERDVSGTLISNFTVQEGERGKLIMTDGNQVSAGRKLKLADFSNDSEALRHGLSEVLRRYGVLTQPLRMEANQAGRFCALVEMQTAEQAALAIQGFDGASYNGEVVRAEAF